ncbi:MAG: hypothetical protein MHMPM18_002924 [Marteilia pararefringens]
MLLVFIVPREDKIKYEKIITDSLLVNTYMSFVNEYKVITEIPKDRSTQGNELKRKSISLSEQQSHITQKSFEEELFQGKVICADIEKDYTDEKYEITYFKDNEEVTNNILRYGPDERKFNPSEIRMIFTSNLKMYQKLQKHYRKGTNQILYTVICIKEQDSRKISQTINTNEVSMKDLSFVDMVYMIKELEKSTVHPMINTIMTNCEAKYRKSIKR